MDLSENNRAENISWATTRTGVLIVAEQAIDTAFAECLAKVSGKAHVLIAQAREDLALCPPAFWPQIGKARNQLQEAIEELTRS